jgi:Cysteine rich repeat
MIRGRSILLLLAIAAPSLASAETMNFESATAILGASCGKDIDANCFGVNLDPVRLKECLARNQDVVSSQCKADYVRAFDAIQKRVAARAAVYKMCERDKQKLCQDAQNGAGRVVECLLTKSRGVSAKCSQAIHEAGYR